VSPARRFDNVVHLLARNEGAQTGISIRTSANQVDERPANTEIQFFVFKELRCAPCDVHVIQRA
jgi:hypothetical protein